MFQTDRDRAPDLALLQDTAGRTGPERTRRASSSSSCGREVVSAPAAAVVHDTGPVAMAPGWWAFCAEARAAEIGLAGARV